MDGWQPLEPPPWEGGLDVGPNDFFVYKKSAGRDVVRLSYEGRAYLYGRRIPRWLGELIARGFLAATAKFPKAP